MSSRTTDVMRMTSDSLHNRNCYRYLKKLSLTPYVMEEFSDSLKQRLEAVQSHSEYNERFPYADVYKQFFTEVEGNIKKIYDDRRERLKAQLKDDSLNHARWEQLKLHEKGMEEIAGASFMRQYKKIITPETIHEKITALDDFIFSIYDNDNSNLEETFKVIQHIPLEHTPASQEIEQGITEWVKDEGDKINKNAQSPAEAGSLYGATVSTLSGNFKPQHDTSIATVRHFEYTKLEHTKEDKKNVYPKEYRFGTQGQRHNGDPRHSPLFERFLKVKEERAEDKEKISHIYFNVLGFDRDDLLDIPGKKERNLTEALHRLGDTHKNIAVITLPADKGLMDKHDYQKINDKHDREDVFNEFLNIASESTDPAPKSKIKDFHISPRVRALLFKNESGDYTAEAQKEKLTKLLNKSFKKLGLDGKNTLTSAERQAVWFHFIKFELTNHIIQTLKPESMNFSCKDAIDRGGVSSAFYNLMKSFKTKHPLSREEFERTLHAAPTMVKGRGINHHLKVIWNAVDAYVNANYDTLIEDEKRSWLIEWRDLNCPHARVADLLDRKIKQSRDVLEAAQKKDPHNPNILKGLEILNQIEQQKNLGVSGKRALLGAVALTPAVALGDVNKAKMYSELADKLRIKYPSLHIVAGLMKTLAGAVLFAATIGHVKNLLHSGLATLKAGQDAEHRAQIVGNMKQVKDELQHLKDENPIEEERSLFENPDAQAIKVQ